MIRFAVQRPPQRKTEIMEMVKNLDWAKDKYLNHFGIKIDSNMPLVKAKLLPNPIVGYAGNKTADPKMSGRWDLRGMKFVTPNQQPLKSWAFVAVDNCVDKLTLDHFAKTFQSTYAGHGGRIERAPLVTGSQGVAHPQMVANVYNQCGSANQAVPQIIFFVLKDKTSAVYDRLKRNAECRFGAITQMMQAQHVRKAQGQYISNVCMKVNAKLGGQTSRIAHSGKETGFFKVPTMMIGVDVSHGAAGPNQERISMAAMCVSMDKEAAIYNAAVQTNGTAVEILQPANMHSMLGPLAVKWRQKHNVKPKHVFYVRDGVSEGQFAHVMQYEVSEMKTLFRNTYGEVPKITVIIATKRHHIRFFPERGDRNGNCLPGTLVEREITHPFHYDFYLCSHVAIQGTARPVHYNVIHDECGLEVDDLQRILYRQCYQYCRATTPVSLHPAVYYAHLASARAHHHASQAGSVRIPSDAPHVHLRRPGLMAKRESKNTVTSQNDPNTQPPPLLEVGADNPRSNTKETFNASMWWV
jgi:eukaryotic translation initiation factor 2C